MYSPIIGLLFGINYGRRNPVGKHQSMANKERGSPWPYLLVNIYIICILLY